MIVVTGATGNVGRVLVDELTRKGEQVRAVSRNAEKYRADLANPEQLRPALDGANALFLLVSGAGAHVDAPAVLDLAKAGGVTRVVLLSSQAAATRPDSVSHAPLRTIESAVRESGLEWTILRPGGFASNAFAWSEQIRTQRTVFAPYAEIGLPIVDPSDIAEVASAVLREDGHAGSVYELTGPRLTTPRQRTAAIAEALGEPLRFVEQSRAEARAQMLRFMPEPVVDGTLDIIGLPTDAEKRISPDIEKVLKKAPRPFEEWARRTVAAFRG